MALIIGGGGKNKWALNADQMTPKMFISFGSSACTFGNFGFSEVCLIEVAGCSLLVKVSRQVSCHSVIHRVLF